MTNEIKITKKDQVKSIVMAALSTGTKTRSELNEAISSEMESSARTNSRALAELKLEGKVIQSIDSETKITSWISLETKKETEIPVPEKKEEPVVIEEKTSEKDAGKTEIPVPEKEEETKTETDTPDAGKTPEKYTNDQEEKEIKNEISVEALKKAAQKGRDEARTCTFKVKRNTKPGTGVKGKKPGIINAIIESISKKAKTKKEIVEFLSNSFPDRDTSKMAKTVGVQVPSRLTKEKGLIIDKTDKGYLIRKDSLEAYLNSLN